MLEESNNRKIAKNSLFLYLRMLVTLGIGLFTSRIVLQSLGIDNYGVYNVVGGVVVAFGFLNMSLTNSSSRFYSVTIAENNLKKLIETSNCIVTIHYGMALFVLLLIETLGIWLLNHKLVIPSESMVAAHWVFQCSAITMFIGIISTPYNAMIISHEHMNMFAFISIFESFSKLAIAYLLFVLPDNLRLIFYSVLILIVQLFVRVLYTAYCKRKFAEANFKFKWNKAISIPILKFAGWTMNGNVAVIGYTQGINILLNIFFGPAVNAARGIAVQVQSAVKQFFMSFQTAINPQIMKSYATGNMDYMHELIIRGSKFSYYLVWALVMPIMLNIDYLLSIWLINPPQYSNSFIIIILCVCLVNTISTPLNYGIQATGDLKLFQLVEGSILLSIVPLAWIGLKYLAFTPNDVFLTYLLIEIITQISRVLIVCKRISINLSEYFNNLILKIFLVSIISFPLPLILTKYLEESFWNLIISIIISECCIILSIWTLGFNIEEKNFIKNKIGIILHKII